MMNEMCYGRPLLEAWLLPDLNTIPNYCVRERELSLALWLWYWLLVLKVTSSNPARTLYICHAFIHLFLCYRHSL